MKYAVYFGDLIFKIYWRILSHCLSHQVVTLAMYLSIMVDNNPLKPNPTLLNGGGVGPNLMQPIVSIHDSDQCHVQLIRKDGQLDNQKLYTNCICVFLFN